MSRRTVEIAGRSLSLSNLEKPLYPETTKAEIIEYYRRISGFILPHLEGRALTMKRYPDGVNGEFFFEKRCPSHRPAWTRTADIPQKDGEPLTACLVNDLETLIWVANLAALELHVPLARAAAPHNPDSVVFDLDPGQGAGLFECARVALILRDLFKRLGLESFVKISGQKGLHVFIPLNNPAATFDDTSTFSRAVAVILQKSHPDLVTWKMAKELRTGKVFINWSQNDAAKTMVCAYSLRARETPVVSFPVPWSEIEPLDPERLKIGHEEALSRVEKSGDHFLGMLSKKQVLPHL